MLKVIQHDSCSVALKAIPFVERCCVRTIGFEEYHHSSFSPRDAKLHMSLGCCPKRYPYWASCTGDGRSFQVCYVLMLGLITIAYIH